MPQTWLLTPPITWQFTFNQVQDMSKTLAIWFFLLFSILTYSAYGSTCTEDTGDFRTSKPEQKEPKRNQFWTSHLLIFLSPPYSFSSYFLHQNNVEIGHFDHKPFLSLHAAMHGMIMGSSKPCSQRKFPELHAARYTRISRLGKAVYRGPSNLRPRNVRNASNSNSIKPPSLFMAALGHLVFGLLLVPCFYRIT